MELYINLIYFGMGLFVFGLIQLHTRLRKINKRHDDIEKRKLAEIAFKQKMITPPFRVGKKQGRAILDSFGFVVTIFPEGMEKWAHGYCEFLNKTVTEPTKR